MHYIEINVYQKSKNVFEKTKRWKDMEKRFKCHYNNCRREFVTLKDLKRHWVVHTGSRDFKCSFCNLVFGRRDHKRRHENKCVSRKKFNKTPDQDKPPAISPEKGTPDFVFSYPNTNSLHFSPTLTLHVYSAVDSHTIISMFI